MRVVALQWVNDKLSEVLPFVDLRSTDGESQLAASIRSLRAHIFLRTKVESAFRASDCSFLI